MPAVGQDRISRIVGYNLAKGFFNETSENLPQRIAIIGEANTANQTGITWNSPQEITTAQQAGQLYGYGSPIHMAMRVLRSVYGDQIGGIPTDVFPQQEPEGAAAKVITVTVTGTATANGTHTLNIAGRTGIDGETYDINIVSGDTATQVAAKIADAVNNVLGCPMTATSSAGVATLTSKWKGLTANDIVVSVETNNYNLGVSYAAASTTSGSGTPSVSTALSNFGNTWYTIVVNTYGTVSAVLTALEAANGKPDPLNPTGRYTGIVFKPFIALTGSTADDPSSVTNTRPGEVTIAICPAPASKGLPLEAAANMCVLYARNCQDTPHLDVAGKTYPDMPTPTLIGSMADYNLRDTIAKKGCSTVDLLNKAYQVQDFITTYNPDGEVPPQYRYARNLMLDFNIRYAYKLLELVYVVDHVIVKDTDVVNAEKVIKPKEWKSVLDSLATSLVSRGLIVDATFMQKSISVTISNVNPDRFETRFKYKRSGVARISSTTAEAGFNFGAL